MTPLKALMSAMTTLQPFTAAAPLATKMSRSCSSTALTVWLGRGSAAITMPGAMSAASATRSVQARRAMNAYP